MRAPWIAGLVTTASCTQHRPLADVAQLSLTTSVVVEERAHIELHGTPMRTYEGIVLRTARGDIPLDQVTRVTEIRRGRGALEGLGIGALVGMGTGAIIGFAEGDDDCSSCVVRFSAGDKAVFGGLVIGTLGAGIGLLAGALRGSRIVYEPGAGPRIVFGGPPGAQVGATLRF
jgi:hypothetical protein